MINIILAIASLGILGIVFGLILAFASKIFAVKTDERLEKIVDVLPNANCGGCGYTGCSAFAAAVVEGKAKVNGCPVGGEIVSKKVGEIMGVSGEEPVRFRAVVNCCGENDKASRKFIYNGVMDCHSAMQIGGGEKECPYGCLGYGDCLKACKFGAISIEYNVAKIDPDKCVACGMCKDACPKGIISLIPYDEDFWVLCASKDKGIVTKNYCKLGCIGCKICEKSCPSGAITVDGSLAKIDYEKCTKCGTCYEKCPRNVIVNYKLLDKE